jgi:hypothetical protein
LCGVASSVNGTVCGVSSAATVPVFCTEVIARGSVSKVLGWWESSERSRILSVIRRASLGDEKSDKNESSKEKESNRGRYLYFSVVITARVTRSTPGVSGVYTWF